MVSNVSNTRGGGSAQLADALFKKLDTKNQGYIDKSDLQTALSAAGKGKGDASVDDAFKALDGDGDGKVTKSELTDAITKLGAQLHAQFDAGRVGKGRSHGGGHGEGAPPPSSGASGASGTSDTSATAGASADPAADTDGDGKVTADEEAAYKKAQASAASGTATPPASDPLRELARALHQLKAYAADDATSSASTTSAVA